MVSTGIYIRVSTDEQAKEGYSIQAQEEKLRQYAGLKDWHIFSVYADEGISGKDIEGRPAIKQMLIDVESGKINNVLVYKIDRLTRSTRNLIDLIDIFNVNQCAFNSLVESIDTASATGRMFLKIVGIFAEFERENLAERVRLGMERKVKEGYAICSYAPSFGYSRENGNKIQEINEAEAAIVRRIFNMYLHDDYSMRSICRLLNAEKILTRAGNKWTDSSIKNVLTNVNYMGKVRYSLHDASRYFEADGQHEPIVEETLFYQVQEKLNKIQKITRTKRPSSEAYYCGVLYCHSCGVKYTTHWQNNKGKDGKTHYLYYTCRNAINDCCSEKGIISHRKMDKAFEEYISRYGDFTENGIEADTIPDNSAEIDTITAEVKTIEKKTEEVMALFMTTAIDFTTYQNMLRFSNERRGELEARLSHLQNVQQAKIPGYTKKEIVANIRERWAGLDNEHRLKFIQQFIKKIVVQKVGRGKITIHDFQFNTF